MLTELVKTSYEPGLDHAVGQAKPTIENFYDQLPPPSIRTNHLLSQDPLAKTQHAFCEADLYTDYLADGARNLVVALREDPVGKGRLEDAIAMFVRAETASKELIESITQQSVL
jgi:hypothetical protein